MSSVENSFGFKFLSSIDGIEKETIDNLMSKGYHSFQSLLSVKFQDDLYPMPDILWEQKSILREAIENLKRNSKQLKIGPNIDEITTTQVWLQTSLR